ncbi:MAG: hypothetical protein JWP88_2337 [Flaviaesturariibacter sp.]|nr:hypothetical protein [Flaviaesturariibacter sp.]
MKIVKTKINSLLAAVALSTLVLQACNKEFETIADTPATGGTIAVGTQTIGAIVATDTTYSYFNALLTKAGTGAPALSNASLRFTAFIPNNAAFRASGPAFATAALVTSNLTATQAASIANYALTPQLLPAEQIPTTFPNLQAPTLLNPTVGTPAFSPFVSLSTFPSRRGTTTWVNNVPLVATNIAASNGIIHNTAVLVSPPSVTLWSRISTDPDMTYFKAAVSRGDSGMVGTARIDSLLNLPIGPNFTVFVPKDSAFKVLLTAQITGALVARGLPLANAQAAAAALVTTYGTTIISNPASIPDAPIFPAGTGIGAALANAFSPTAMKGIGVYHILGVRAFTVNFPTTATAVPTLLNSAVPTHPGVMLQATFGPTGVTAATVKGAANTTASNLLINPTPNPGGTSEQHFTNGVLHKIDQVLRPQ